MKMILGEMLKKWRLVNDISAVDLAKDIGIDQNVFTYFERNGSCELKNFVKIMDWVLKDREKKDLSLKKKTMWVPDNIDLFKEKELTNEDNHVRR